MASAAGYMRAPPKPWITRHVTIHASAKEPVGVRPQATDESANTTMPMTTILRWPIMSASLPPKANIDASASR